MSDDNFIELMRNKYRKPIWLNITKTLIEVEEHTKTPSKGDRVTNLVFPKYDDEDETVENYLFALVTSVYSEEEIDKLTEEENQQQKENAEEEKKAEELNLEMSRLENLFKAKLDIFNIPEIYQSDNKELKSKIRKAKSNVEATAYAVILLQNALEEK